MSITAARNTTLHTVQGFLSKKNPIRYNTMNITWVLMRAGLTGFGINSTGISHCKQYIAPVQEILRYTIVSQHYVSLYAPQSTWFRRYLHYLFTIIFRLENTMQLRFLRTMLLWQVGCVAIILFHITQFWWKEVQSNEKWSIDYDYFCKKLVINFEGYHLIFIYFRLFLHCLSNYKAYSKYRKNIANLLTQLLKL